MKKNTVTEETTDQEVISDIAGDDAQGVVEESGTDVEMLARELAEANDKLLRLRAEYDNYRKRVFKDMEMSRQMARIDTVMPFLQVFDHLNMAMKSADVSDNIEALKQGLRMILGEYDRAFDELGVEKFDASGKTFDPAMHEAMANEASEEIPEGVVISQWSYGYKLGDRLLRPARVVVSKGSEQK